MESLRSCRQLLYSWPKGKGELAYTSSYLAVRTADERGRPETDRQTEALFPVLPQGRIFVYLSVEQT